MRKVFFLKIGFQIYKQYDYNFRNINVVQNREISSNLIRIFFQSILVAKNFQSIKIQYTYEPCSLLRFLTMSMTFNSNLCIGSLIMIAFKTLLSIIFSDIQKISFFPLREEFLINYSKQILNNKPFNKIKEKSRVSASHELELVFSK